MRLRQEQTVFVLSVLVLGVMTWGLFTGQVKQRRSRGTSQEAEFTHHAAPDVDIAVTNGSVPRLSRELFSPPRDTHPLPPLELIEPPRHPLDELIAPTDPGPAPRAYGKLLRRQVAFTEAPALFGGEVEELDAFTDTTGTESGALLVEEELSVSELLAQAAATGDPFADETPAERAARTETYKRTYDWIQRGPAEFLFGRIVNEDRYGLRADKDRANEAIEFVQVDPVTGIETLRSVGAPPVSYERALMVDFDFADQVANEIEVRRLLVGGKLVRGTFDEALELARYALLHRHSAPRALEIAEELFRLCADYDQDDLVPRLGLARALEFDFRFEEAFAEYTAVLDKWPHRAEPYVALALLEERCLLYEKAEERLQAAMTVDRTNWEARFGLGTFLSRRGRHAEALEHLRAAVRSAPTEPELLHLRVSTRVALADALFGLGEVEEARGIYEQAAKADPAHQRARAGLVASGVFLDGGGASPVAASVGSTDDEAGEGFDLLVARGVAAMLEGDYTTSRDLLTLAVRADPLRASTPLAALAFLAHGTGHDADALGFVEEALEHSPRDTYALYLKGRMLGDQDDYEGARSALTAALNQEVDFEDALVALGDMAFRLGRFEDAERYLERAITIEDTRPEVFSLRGINFLKLGSVREARDAFDAALVLDRQEPTAKAGKAWCAYLDGEVTESLVLLNDLDDARRDQPEGDAWRLWARAQIERVQEHVEKVEWRDNFNRTRLINGWESRQSDGPTVSMEDGAAKIEGVFTSMDGKAQIYRELPASEFVSFSASVWISSGDTTASAGLFIARERQRRGQSDVIGEASVRRFIDGALQLRFVRQGQPVDLTDMEQEFPTDRWVKLTIERSGVGAETSVTITLDGIPLIEGKEVPSIGGANSPLLIGLQVEGDTGKQVKVLMDEASLVYRGNR